MPEGKTKRHKRPDLRPARRRYWEKGQLEKHMAAEERGMVEWSP